MPALEPINSCIDCCIVQMTKQKMRFPWSAAAAVYLVMCVLRLPIKCQCQPPPDTFLMTSSSSSNSGLTRHRQPEEHQVEISRPIRFAAVEAAPFLTRSGRDGVRGFIVDLLDNLSRQIGLPFELTVERLSGKRRKDGHWTGLIGKLLAHEIDAGVIAYGQHQMNDHKLLLTHQSITESTLSLLVNSAADVSRKQNQRFIGRHSYLEDLLNDTSIGLGVVLHSRVEQLLRRSELPVHQVVWNRLAAAAATIANRSSSSVATKSPSSTEFSLDVVFTTLESGIQHAVENPRFILITESSDSVFSTLTAPGCRLTVHDQYFPVAKYHFAVSLATATAASGSSSNIGHLSRSETSNSSIDPVWLIRLLDAALTRLHDAGIVRQLHDRWWTSSHVDRSCVESSAPSGQKPSKLDRIPPSSQVGHHDDDWRARERIFFESPLRRSTVSSTVVETSTTDSELIVSTSQTDVDLMTWLSGYYDVDKTTTAEPMKHSKQPQLIDDSVTAVDEQYTKSELLTTSDVSETTIKQIKTTVTRRPKRMTTPRTHRQKHNRNSTSTPSRRPPMTSTLASRSRELSNDAVIDRLFVTHRVLNLENVTADEHVFIHDVKIEEIGEGDATEQEMAVKDHWRRRQTEVELSPQPVASLDGVHNEVRSEKTYELKMATGSCESKRCNRMTYLLVIFVSSFVYGLIS